MSPTVDMKIVLRRAVNGSEETPRNSSPRRRRRSTLHNAMIGMVVCWAKPVIGKEYNTPRHRKRPRVSEYVYKILMYLTNKKRCYI